MKSGLKGTGQPGAATKRKRTVKWTKNPLCQHHWLIEPPDGPTSVGKCKKCTAVRGDFVNSYRSGGSHWVAGEKVG